MAAGVPAVIFICGLALAFVTPPFEIPDETAHFLRAWDLSQGGLVPHERGSELGGYFPSDVALLSAVAGFSEPGSPVNHYDTRALIDLAEDSTTIEGPRQFAAYTAFGILVPVAYSPQALAIAGVRLMGGSPLLCFYGARVANLAVAVLLLSLAIHVSRSLELVASSVAGLPMTLSLFGSLSGDALLIACAIVVGCTAFGERSRLRDVLLFGAALLVSLVKVVYLPILLFPLLVRTTQSRSSRLLYVAIVGTGFAASALWARFLYRPYRGDSPTNAWEQLAFVFGNPVTAVATLTRDLVGHGPRYVSHMIGRLGWLDVGLPLWVYVLWVGVLVGAGLTAASMSPKLRLSTCALVVIAVFAVHGTIFLIWTPVGSHTVEGFQGRYLLPILPVAMLALGRGWVVGPRLRAVLLGWVCCSTFVACATLVAQKWQG